MVSIFKKKKSIKSIPTVLSIPVNEIPREALNIIYAEKMKEYQGLNGKGNDTLQMELSVMWKYLREGTNSEYYEYFESKGIPRDAIQQASADQLKRLKKNMEVAELALKELHDEDNKPKADELETEIESLIKEKIKQDRIKIQKENQEEDNFSKIQKSRLEKLVKIEKPKGSFLNKLIKTSVRKEAEASINLDHDESMQTQSEVKDEKVFLNDVTVVEPKPEPKHVEPERTTVEHIEEEKPKKTGFFKKKVKKNLGKLPDKPLKPIAEKKSIGQKFSIKKKKEGYDLKDNELICTDCGHYLKSHQKGGVSSGCIKCGCLVTIEEIAQKHGEKLKVHGEEPSARIIEEPKPQEFIIPSNVVPPLEQEVQQEPQQVPKEIPKEIPEPIIKQAKQIESMVKKDVPKGFPDTPKDENQYIEEDEKCICDHVKSKHYEGKFCFSCDCSSFIPYRDDPPRKKNGIEQKA